MPGGPRAATPAAFRRAPPPCRRMWSRRPIPTGRRATPRPRDPATMRPLHAEPAGIRDWRRGRGGGHTVACTLTVTVPATLANMKGCSAAGQVDDPQGVGGGGSQDTGGCASAMVGNRETDRAGARGGREVHPGRPPADDAGALEGGGGVSWSPVEPVADPEPAGRRGVCESERDMDIPAHMGGPGRDSGPGGHIGASRDCGGEGSRGRLGGGHDRGRPPQRGDCVDG